MKNIQTATETFNTLPSNPLYYHRKSFFNVERLATATVPDSPLVPSCYRYLIGKRAPAGFVEFWNRASWRYNAQKYEWCRTTHEKMMSWSSVTRRCQQQYIRLAVAMGIIEHGSRVPGLLGMRCAVSWRPTPEWSQSKHARKPKKHEGERAFAISKNSNNSIDDINIEEPTKKRKFTRQWPSQAMMAAKAISSIQRSQTIIKEFYLWLNILIFLGFNPKQTRAFRGIFPQVTVEDFVEVIYEFDKETRESPGGWLWWQLSIRAKTNHMKEAFKPPEPPMDIKPKEPDPPDDPNRNLKLMAKDLGISLEELRAQFEDGFG